MKITRIFFFIWLIPALSPGQISLDSASFAGIGTHYVMGTDTLVPLTVSQGGAGTGQTWDLSGVTTHLVDTVDVVDPTTTPYYSNYAGANFCSRDLTMGDTVYTYGTASSSEVRIMGFVMDPLQSGNKFVLHATPPAKAFVFPYQLGVSYMDTSGGELRESGANVGVATVDSIRYKSTSYRNVVVDGEGSLTLGSGVYSCLRQKEINRSIDTIWAKVIFIGWTMVQATDRIDSTFSYMSDSLGFVVAEVKFDSASAGQIASVRYLGPNPPVVHRELSPNVDFTLYPNPASQSISLSHALKGAAKAEVYSPEGKLLLSSSLNSKVSRLDVSGLAPGIYFVKLQSADGVSGVRRLIISR